MNERIQELAEQAGFYVAMFDPSNKDNAMIEKFAEMIVRECMSISASIGEHGHIAAEEMGQHFGVKS